jgi:hypothetical protein
VPSVPCPRGREVALQVVNQTIEKRPGPSDTTPFHFKYAPGGGHLSSGSAKAADPLRPVADRARPMSSDP